MTNTEIAECVARALVEAEKGDLMAAAQILREEESFTEEDVWLTIAGHLYSGNGVAQDKLRAIALWKALADRGSVHAMALFGRVTVTGDEIKQDIPEGINLLTEAAEAGYAYAWGWLSQIFQGGVPGVDPDPEKVIFYLEQGAKSGDTNAMLTLATFLGAGQFTLPSATEALRWNFEAAKVGSLKAHYNLGVAYQYGKGSPIDMVRARRYYGIAAEGGIPRAKSNYAALLYKGEGGDRNAVEAKMWWEQAALQGMANAQVSLANLYLEGDVVEQSPSIALAWFLVAERYGFEGLEAKISRVLEQLSASEVSNARATAEALEARITPVSDRSFN